MTYQYIRWLLVTFRFASCDALWRPDSALRKTALYSLLYSLFFLRLLLSSTFNAFEWAQNSRPLKLTFSFFFVAKMESQSIRTLFSSRTCMNIQVQTAYPLLTYVSSEASTPFIPLADDSWLNPRWVSFFLFKPVRQHGVDSLTLWVLWVPFYFKWGKLWISVLCKAHLWWSKLFCTLNH